MKRCFLIALAVFSIFAYSNSLHSLVFDFSDDLKVILPDDGWVKLSFNVVNYSGKEMRVRFNAVCVESGLALPYYPQDTLTLHPDAEQTITVFMNRHCGQLTGLPSGQHSRTIQYSFINMVTGEKLTFHQSYIIVVPQKFAAEEACLSK